MVSNTQDREISMVIETAKKSIPVEGSDFSFDVKSGEERGYQNGYELEFRCEKYPYDSGLFVPYKLFEQMGIDVEKNLIREDAGACILRGDNEIGIDTLVQMLKRASFNRGQLFKNNKRIRT